MEAGERTRCCSRKECSTERHPEGQREEFNAGRSAITRKSGPTNLNFVVTALKQSARAAAVRLLGNRDDGSRFAAQRPLIHPAITAIEKSYKLTEMGEMASAEGTHGQ